MSSTLEEYAELVENPLRENQPRQLPRETREKLLEKQREAIAQAAEAKRAHRFYPTEALAVWWANPKAPPGTQVVFS